MDWDELLNNIEKEGEERYRSDLVDRMCDELMNIFAVSPSIAVLIYEVVNGLNIYMLKMGIELKEEQWEEVDKFIRGLLNKKGGNDG